MDKDHINFCCINHGCYYKDDNCIVTNGIEKQLYLCNHCTMGLGRMRGKGHQGYIDYIFSMRKLNIVRNYKIEKILL